MDKSHKNKSAEDHINQQFVTRDEKHGWLGQEIEVNSDPLVDEGLGETVSLRVFDFGANPEALKRDKPTKQDLFNSHARQIQHMLWADGLQVIPEMNPLIQVSKKKEKYRIMVWCKASKGNYFSYATQPKKLQEIINPNAT